MSSSVVTLSAVATVFIVVAIDVDCTLVVSAEPSVVDTGMVVVVGVVSCTVDAFIVDSIVLIGDCGTEIVVLGVSGCVEVLVDVNIVIVEEIIVVGGAVVEVTVDELIVVGITVVLAVVVGRKVLVDKVVLVVEVIGLVVEAAVVEVVVVGRTAPYST